MRTLIICIFSIFIMSYNLPASFAASELEGKQLLESILKRANDGDAEAQYILGGMYANGHGVRQDYQKAKEWIEKAAQQGLARAQCSLGEIYANAYGVRQDFQQAKTWFEKAAQQGHAEAQYNLGLMYAKGHGSSLDYQQAKEYFGLACDNGLQAGCDKYKELNTMRN